MRQIMVFSCFPLHRVATKVAPTGYHSNAPGLFVRATLVATRPTRRESSGWLVLGGIAC